MDLPIMLMPVVTKYIIVLLLALSGCAISAPENNRDGLLKYIFEDPERYAVDSKGYPNYRIESSIYRPPSDMVKGNAVNEPKEQIRVTDLWSVTHVCNGYYYVFSDEYQKRQEQLIKNSYFQNITADYYLYHLVIDKTGKVFGWVTFKNKKVVLLRSERRIVFDPNYWRNPEWDNQPGLRPVER